MRRPPPSFGPPSKLRGRLDALWRNALSLMCIAFLVDSNPDWFSNPLHFSRSVVKNMAFVENKEGGGWSDEAGEPANEEDELSNEYPGEV